MRGHCALALSLLLASQLSESYKFLGFSPQWAVSHVNYLGKIADSLVDAGHEVVSLLSLSCKEGSEKEECVLSLWPRDYMNKAILNLCCRKQITYWKWSGSSRASRRSDDKWCRHEESTNHRGIHSLNLSLKQPFRSQRTSSPDDGTVLEFEPMICTGTEAYWRWFRYVFFLSRNDQMYFYQGRIRAVQEPYAYNEWWAKRWFCPGK